MSVGEDEVMDLGQVTVGDGEPLLKVLNRLVHHDHHKKDLEKGTQDSFDQNGKKPRRLQKRQYACKHGKRW